MKTVKSYSKTPLLLSRICAVSFAIFVLASCGSDSDKPLVEAPRDPAGTYREYLSDIRRQANPSFTVLTKHIRRWQTVKDSVFTCIKRDTLGSDHSALREECVRLHDSVRIEFSRLILSRPRTYRELLALKGEFSPYGKDEELHHAAEDIRPFFASLDNRPASRGGKRQVLAKYRALLSETLQKGIHSREDLTACIGKEDALFRAFLTHLYDLDGENTADIMRDTERCCSQLFLAAEREEITYREATLYLAMRTNRRQIQNMQACIDDVRDKKVKTSAQAQAYIWMLVQPYASLDGFFLTLLSDRERKQLDRMAAQTPAAFKALSRTLQSESARLDELPGMLMEIFIYTL